MALNTGSIPGEQQSVFAKAPTFPEGLGKIDVGAIYDAATKAMGQPEALANAARQGTAGNTALKTLLQQETAKRSLIPAQTQAAAAEAAYGTAKPGALAGMWNANPQLAASVEKGNVPTTTNAATYIDTDPNSPTKGQVVNKNTVAIGGQTVGGATTASPYNFTVDELMPPEAGVAGIKTNSYYWDPSKGARTVPDANGKMIPNPASTTLVNSTTAPVIPREQPDKLQQAIDGYVRARQTFPPGPDGKPTPQMTTALEAYSRVAQQTGVAPPPPNPESEKLINDAVATQEAINAEKDPAKAAVLGARLQDIRNRQAKINEPVPTFGPMHLAEAAIRTAGSLADTYAKMAVAATDDKQRAEYLAKSEAYHQEAKQAAVPPGTPAVTPSAAPAAAPSAANLPKTVNVGGVEYPTVFNTKTGQLAYEKDGQRIPLGPNGAAPAEPAPAAPAAGVPPLLARPEAPGAPAPVAPAAPAAEAAPVSAPAVAAPLRKGTSILARTLARPKVKPEPETDEEAAEKTRPYFAEDSIPITEALRRLK